MLEGDQGSQDGPRLQGDGAWNLESLPPGTPGPALPPVLHSHFRPMLLSHAQGLEIVSKEMSQLKELLGGLDISPNPISSLGRAPEPLLGALRG